MSVYLYKNCGKQTKPKNGKVLNMKKALQRRGFRAFSLVEMRGIEPLTS